MRDSAESIAAQIAAPAADSDLACLIVAWDNMPATVRAGITAMVAAATEADQSG